MLWWHKRNRAFNELECRDVRLFPIRTLAGGKECKGTQRAQMKACHAAGRGGAEHTGKEWSPEPHSPCHKLAQVHQKEDGTGEDKGPTRPWWCGKQTWLGRVSPDGLRVNKQAMEFCHSQSDSSRPLVTGWSDCIYCATFNTGLHQLHRTQKYVLLPKGEKKPTREWKMASHPNLNVMTWDGTHSETPTSTALPRRLLSWSSQPHSSGRTGGWRQSCGQTSHTQIHRLYRGNSSHQPLLESPQESTRVGSPAYSALLRS